MLQKIEQSLKTNHNLGFVHKDKDLSFCGGKRYVDYFVAPRKRLNTKESLQKFMVNLIPRELNLSRNWINFDEECHGYLGFGYLYFRDYDNSKIGETNIEVHPFPSVSFVKDILKGKISRGITSTMFKKKILNENYGFSFPTEVYTPHNSKDKCYTTIDFLNEVMESIIRSSPGHR